MQACGAGTRPPPAHPTRGPLGGGFRHRAGSRGQRAVGGLWACSVPPAALTTFVSLRGALCIRGPHSPRTPCCYRRPPRNGGGAAPGAPIGQGFPSECQGPRGTTQTAPHGAASSSAHKCHHARAPGGGFVPTAHTAVPPPALGSPCPHWGPPHSHWCHLTSPCVLWLSPSPSATDPSG